MGMSMMVWLMLLGWESGMTRVEFLIKNNVRRAMCCASCNWLTLADKDGHFTCRRMEGACFGGTDSLVSQVFICDLYQADPGVGDGGC